MLIFINLIQFLLLINYSQCWFLDHLFSSDNLSTKWLNYRKAFKKFYKNEYEFELRKKIFESNLDFVNRLNEQYASGQISFQTDVNSFADLTDNEFLQQKTGLIVEPNDKNAEKPPRIRHKREIMDTLPAHIDWRTSGKVSPVQDQGTCGSCYAFATVANCESFKAIRSNYMPKYSVQELIDCSVKDNSLTNLNCNGCNGGSLSCGFEYVKRNSLSDINIAKKYKSSFRTSSESILFSSYRGAEGVCRRSENDALINNYATYYRDSYAEEIQYWLATFGPISIGINAAPRSFQFYKSGIYDGQCSDELNHAVLLVGYGRENGKDYWIIKNSWGAWGEAGFMRIARGHNKCGVESYGAFAFN